jgi:hypothetical protein
LFERMRHWHKSPQAMRPVFFSIISFLSPHD